MDCAASFGIGTDAVAVLAAAAAAAAAAAVSFLQLMD